jgi:DNA (cytosine-5)-methyltransferase 1
MVKILNLYSGIGGNRKLWEGHEITAVEHREDIADIYRHYFPNDTLVIGDAHQYLLDHYQEFDFIWTSRPCTTHSRANFWASRNADNRDKYYPDFGLYEEITFLKYWFNGKWVAENVIPYYDIPLLFEPTKKMGRHLFWANFNISDIDIIEADIRNGTRKEWSELHGFDLSGFKINSRKDQIYRNCVHPETGLHILNCAEGKSLIKNGLQQQILFGDKI